MFASSVPIIGMADPAKTIKPNSSGSQAISGNSGESGSIQNALASSSGVKVDVAETPVSTSAGKKSKGRKKA